MNPVAVWLESPAGDAWRREHLQPAADDGETFAQIKPDSLGRQWVCEPFSARRLDPRFDPCGRAT